jgi:hypothetical protein
VGSAARWNQAIIVAVRRFIRMKNMPAAAAPRSWSKAPATRSTRSSSPNKKPLFPSTQPTQTLCDDCDIVRRIYIDPRRIHPDGRRAQKFVDDKDKNKRANLIDALLKRKDDYAANWVPFWEDALVSNGNHQGGVGTHGNYRQWILDNFKANKAYDAMALELLRSRHAGKSGALRAQRQPHAHAPERIRHRADFPRHGASSARAVTAISSTRVAAGAGGA